jgi:hypothetical protein
MNMSDIDKLQTGLKRLGEWADENEMKINPVKSKAVRFTKARLKERIRYYFGGQLTHFIVRNITLQSTSSSVTPL